MRDPPPSESRGVSTNDAHALYLFFRSGGRRCPRFNNDFFTLVFGFAFDFALDFGRAAGASAERACFLRRPTDPSVAAAFVVRHGPCKNF